LEDLWGAFEQAIRLIVSRDPDVMGIAWRSLWIAAASTAICVVICLPLGSLINFNKFRGKHLLLSLLQTLFSMPTVVVGLFVYVMVSHSGPLGMLDLVFTPAAMVVGQTLLIIPMMLGLVISAFSGVDKAVMETATSLGANRLQAYTINIREAKFPMMTAIAMGFGRAISEVGASMIIGGNIKGYTMTLTTGISQYVSMGLIEQAFALGIILIFMALLINIAIYLLQKRRQYVWFPS